MAVTKNILPIADYQVWTSANCAEGDILGIYESLGGRGAKSVRIESTGGISTVRFNVVKQIYKEHDALHNPVFAPAPNPSPLLVAEIEEAAPDVVVGSNSYLEWSASELSVRDVKVVTSSGLRVIVT